MTPNFPIPYIETSLRFAPEGIECKGDTWQRGCAAADGEPAFAIHTYDGKHFCAYHSAFDNKYVPCTRCGERPVIKPESIEVDPVCMTCQKEMAEDEMGCPGFDDSCDNLRKKGKRLCEDCEGKRQAHAGTTVFAATIANPGCPGWGTGEDCGNPKMPGGDLCGDCHGARTDHESPRIPN